jgi:hypothetical protein
MKATVIFILAAGAVIAGSALLLMLLFPDAASHEALTVAALLAFAVHLVSFVLARRLWNRSMWGAWVSGSLMRFGTLVVFAVLAAKVLMYPLVPSLAGCAVFLFLPTLFEPLLLRR